MTRLEQKRQIAAPGANRASLSRRTSCHSMDQGFAIVYFRHTLKTLLRQ
jgi:hypothetical protein